MMFSVLQTSGNEGELLTWYHRGCFEIWMDVLWESSGPPGAVLTCAASTMILSRDTKLDPATQDYCLDTASPLALSNSAQASCKTAPQAPSRTFPRKLHADSLFQTAASWAGSWCTLGSPPKKETLVNDSAVEPNELCSLMPRVLTWYSWESMGTKKHESSRSN